MRIIFSRKGFDSSAGGIASPIMPDSRLLPLPIPQEDGPLTFAQLKFAGQTVSSIIKQLGGHCWRERCHLDPDLDASLIERPADWLPAFGQFGSAQRHLEQEQVQPGDLFLFFGWFRQTERVAGKLRFVKGAPNLHLLHSWLQIGEIYCVDEQAMQRFPGLALHPHLRKSYSFNTLYLPAATLKLPDAVQPWVSSAAALPGSGMFSHWHAVRQLTLPGEQRSVWRLPMCFAPHNCNQVLSYHRKPHRWLLRDGWVQLQAAYRGQEFVVRTEDKQGLSAWLQNVFELSGSDSLVG